MNRYKFGRSATDGQESIGWISISEVFLLCGVLLLAISLALETRLGESRSETVAAQERLRSLEQRLAQLPPDILSVVAELAEANRQLKTLRDELDERQRRVADLTRERDLARERQRLLDDQVSELIQKNGLLAAERDRLDRLRQQLTAETAILEQKVAMLQHLVDESRQIAEDKDRRLKKLESELIARSREVEVLEQKVTMLQRLVDESRQIAEGKDRKIKELLARGERIVRPLQGAELIVTITCRGLPDPFDLDLYVQNPSNQICSWNRPRLLTGNAETGILILSEDLRDRAEQPEEVFYSSNTPLTDPTHPYPYLVFGMIRDVRPRKERVRNPLSLPAGLTIGFKVEVRRGDKAEETKGLGEPKPVSAIGEVYINNGDLIFDQLVPLCGFELSRQINGLTAKRADLPRTLRGYESVTMPTRAQIIDRLR